MPYSTEIVREIWDDKHGDHFEVGPDRDCLNMVEIRFRDDKGVLGGRLTFTPEQARLVAQAMIACAVDMDYIREAD